MVRSDLYPTDTLLIGFTIQDFANKFGYKGVLIGEDFTFDNGEMYFGDEAVEKFEEIQYNQVEEDIIRDMRLEHLLINSEGIPC